MALRTIRSNEDSFLSYWDTCFHLSHDQHPLYQPENLSYYRAFSADQTAENSIDRSFVVADHIDVLAAIRMFTVKRDGFPTELSCFATIPVWFYENAIASINRQRKTRAAIKTEISDVIEKGDIARIWYEDPLLNQELSFLGKLLLNLGATAQPIVRQIIDLNRTEAEMFKQIRKSYKSLINKGRRDLDLSTYDKNNVSDGIMEQFRKLHVAAAGRETRTKETWQIQQNMIKAGEAFAIFGKLEGELVTAALFPLSKHYCYYGVSASNRLLFDKPLSHAVLWEAILYAQKTGCRFFELGPIQFPGIGDPVPTLKELSISTFKHGFGGRSEPRLSIIWERDQRHRP